HLPVVEPGQVAQQQRCPPLEAQHGQGTLDRVHPLRTAGIDLRMKCRSGALKEPRDAVRPGWIALSVLDGTGHRAEERGAAVSAHVATAATQGSYALPLVASRPLGTSTLSTAASDALSARIAVASGSRAGSRRPVPSSASTISVAVSACARMSPGSALTSTLT